MEQMCNTCQKKDTCPKSGNFENYKLGCGCMDYEEERKMKKKYVYCIGGQVTIDESEILTIYAEDEEMAREKAVDEFCNDMKNSYNLSMTMIDEATLLEVHELEPKWILHGGYEYICSLCGKTAVFSTSYCPHCGEKMKNGVVL